MVNPADWSNMNKIKVLQQVLDPSGAGGVSAEYRALLHSNLIDKYDFSPMILTDFRPGLNWHDIRFYYDNIKESDADIIHIRGAAVDGLNAVIAAKMAGSGKILVTVHGMYSDLVYINFVKKWVSKNIVERFIFMLADGISCVCQKAEERTYFDRYRKKMVPFVYNRMPHFDKEKRTEYRNEVRQAYHIPESAVVGVFVGRMTKEKGLEVLLHAFAALEPVWPDNLVFLFVGDGDYRRVAEAACAPYGNRVIFVGNQSDVERFYDASDFFIQPSLHENHSIALLEACAAGLPSIASDCGGNTEIVDEQTGVIVQTGDDTALEEAILTMCEDERRRQFANAVERKDYEKFSDVSVDRALDHVYQIMMEK